MGFAAKCFTALDSLVLESEDLSSKPKSFKLGGTFSDLCEVVFKKDLKPTLAQDTSTVGRGVSVEMKAAANEASASFWKSLRSD